MVFPQSVFLIPPRVTTGYSVCSAKPRVESLEVKKQISLKRKPLTKNSLQKPVPQLVTVKACISSGTELDPP